MASSAQMDALRRPDAAGTKGGLDWPAGPVLLTLRQFGPLAVEPLQNCAPLYERNNDNSRPVGDREPLAAVSPTGLSNRRQRSHGHIGHEGPRTMFLR